MRLQLVSLDFCLDDPLEFLIEGSNPAGRARKQDKAVRGAQRRRVRSTTTPDYTESEPDGGPVHPRGG